MNSIGFGKPFEYIGKDGKRKLTIGLKNLPNDLSKIKRLPSEIIGKLKSIRTQIEQEIIALEGSPSILSAVREISSNHTKIEVINGLETALSIVKNVIKNPGDIRMYRIKRGNPMFFRNLGRLNGSILLMNSIGFIEKCSNDTNNLDDLSSTFVLKSIGSTDDVFDAAFEFPRDSTENRGN
jgi:hypothetical protein